MRGPAIVALISQGAIQPTLFDNQDMAEITSPDDPRERLVACCNPFLEAERARKRGELLAATEAEPAKISAATRRARRVLRGKDNIALAVGKVINKKKVAKHFITEITDETLTCGGMNRRSPPRLLTEPSPQPGEAGLDVVPCRGLHEDLHVDILVAGWLTAEVPVGHESASRALCGRPSITSD